MHIIGITGGVGCGKSTVLAYLREQYAAVVVQADEVARRLQCPGQAVYREMTALFGPDAVLEDGSLNRARIAERVFADPVLRLRLNRIVHPAVKQEVRRQIAQAKQAGVQLFFLEAALLIEDHYDEICDELWFIDTDDAVRTTRLTKSRGYSKEKIASMIASQRSRAEFTAHCQVVIDNSGAFSDTKEQIDRQLTRILSVPV